MTEKWVRMEKWVRVVLKDGSRVLHDARYLCCAEDREALRNDVLSLLSLAMRTGAQLEVEVHEFWAPQREVRHYDSGNLFAIR